MPTHVFDLGKFSILDHLILFLKCQELVISYYGFPNGVDYGHFSARCSAPIDFSCGWGHTAFSGIQPCCLWVEVSIAKGNVLENKQHWGLLWGFTELAEFCFFGFFFLLWSIEIYIWKISVWYINTVWVLISYNSLHIQLVGNQFYVKGIRI